MPTYFLKPEITVSELEDLGYEVEFYENLPIYAVKEVTKEREIFILLGEGLDGVDKYEIIWNDSDEQEDITEYIMDLIYAGLV